MVRRKDAMPIEPRDDRRRPHVFSTVRQPSRLPTSTYSLAGHSTTIAHCTRSQRQKNRVIIVVSIPMHYAEHVVLFQLTDTPPSPLVPESMYRDGKQMTPNTSQYAMTSRKSIAMACFRGGKKKCRKWENFIPLDPNPDPDSDPDPEPDHDPKTGVQNNASTHDLLIQPEAVQTVVP